MAVLSLHSLGYFSRRSLMFGKRDVLRSVLKSGRICGFTQKRGFLFRMANETPPRIVGYYITLPSIPDQAVENNSFMANIVADSDWPSLTAATPQQFYEGTIRMLLEYGATIQEHVARLKELAEEDQTFTTVLEPLLTQEYQINYAFHTLVLKMLTDWPLCSKQEFAADLHHLKFTCAREVMSKLTHPVFQDAIKGLFAKRQGLTNMQIRLLEFYLLEIKSSGLDIRDRKKRKLLASWSAAVELYRIKYLTGITATNDQNIFTVDDRKKIADAPPYVLKLLAADPHDVEKGPWKAQMSPQTIMPLLQYCSDRGLRELAWSKWTSRASFEHDFYNNSVNIEEIRHNNEGSAKCLGYSSVAEHRLENKMAASPQIVRHFISALAKRIRPVFIDRMEVWTTFANERESIMTDLMPSDLFYLCRKEAHAYYEVDALDLMNHFPFWQTFKNIIGVLCYIFNLKFKDVTKTGLDRCHTDVRIFAVQDQSTGEHCGRLYIDPFERPNKRGNWTTLLGRMHDDRRGLDKIVYMIGHADAPASESPSLLHYTQLQELLFNVGRALQLLCSKVPYRDIAIPWAPMYAADWDAADLFPTFVQFFIYRPNLLKVISSPHLKTGEALSEAYANCISLSLSRATLWESYRTLFWADFDLTVFEMEDRRKKFWLDIYREKYKEYFPFRRGRDDYHPCSFTPIFDMLPFMSTYYRKLWVEMLALDVHDTFDSEDDVRFTGERFKRSILEKGAGDMQTELYRRFQGRDPLLQPICDFYDPPSEFAADVDGEPGASDERPK